MIAYKACSACGTLPEVPKTIKDRVHRCVRCWYEADPDLNVAFNIQRLGSGLQARTSSVDGIV
jgi:transposase